jgi:hypothetical protein
MKSALKRKEKVIARDKAPVEVCDPFKETLEEHLMEVAFAEAADYDDIHKAILQERLRYCVAA